MSSCAFAFLVFVCRITQTPGCHGWVRELADNEGDVPQLLPVSDACLNQEWREKLTLLAYKSSLLSRQMWKWIYVHTCLGFWVIGLIPLSHPEHDIFVCSHAQCFYLLLLWLNLQPCGQCGLLVWVFPPTHFLVDVPPFSTWIRELVFCLNYLSLYHM